jgi:cytoskeletal protein CcmA (bactofilin family)
MKEYIDLRNQDFSFFGKGSKISGVFTLKGATHLAGEIEGELHVEDEAELSIDRSGHLKGTINCHNIEIFGEFEGELNSSGKVTIYPPAIICGVINARDLVVYPGAKLNIDGHTNNATQ